MHNGLPFPIVIVEDDEDDRMMIDEAFQEIEYDAEVKKVINGKMLFHYLEQIDASLYPSLIVLDNTVPVSDATDIVRRLQRTPAYRSIPVVVYSTSLSPSQKQELQAAGVHKCLEKGDTLESIVEVAKELKSIAEQKAVK
ncbi:MAG TPA: response regulator [Chitinophagaceae bacterium]|jgi:CheY-like chemotaxis protein|nr:response regulator [Chitinophagaceae bacterium]